MTNRLHETPETLDMGELFRTRGGSYVLRVKGTSLIEEHITEGDYVIVERAGKALPGQLAVYLLPDGIRSLRRSTDTLPDGSKVEGVLIGVIRTYPKAGGAL